MKRYSIYIFLILLLLFLVGGGYYMKRFVIDADNVSVVTLPDVVVESPKPDARVSSPLTIRGKAKGSWFFEGSFPIVIHGEDGSEIAKGIATGEDNWMTDQYVPFHAEILFITKKGTHGTIEFKKDNPSGLPEHDASITIPVAF